MGTLQPSNFRAAFWRLRRNTRGADRRRLPSKRCVGETTSLRICQRHDAIKFGDQMRLRIWSQNSCDKRLRNSRKREDQQLFEMATVRALNILVILTKWLSDAVNVTL